MPQAYDEVMTMWSGHSLFAVPIKNVLSITQETKELHCLAFKSESAIGITRYLETPVSVIDLAKISGFASVIEEKTKLIKMLQQREEDHNFWMDELEKAIVDNQAFSYPRDAHQCQFGKWCQSFKTEDEELYQTLSDLSEPHNRLHGLADKLLTLSQSGNMAEALVKLQNERNTTLKKLNQLLRRAATQLKNSVRPVYLFLTLNGETPCVALLADEIASVEAAGSELPVSIKSMGIPQKNRHSNFIAGYLQLKSEKDCLLIDVEKLGNASELLQKQLKTG